MRSTFNERYRGGWVVGCLDSRLFTTVRVQSSIRCCLLSIFKAPRHLSFPNSCETLIFIDYRVKKCISALSFKWRIEVSFDWFYDKFIDSFLFIDLIIIDLSGVAVYCSQVVDEVISKWGHFCWRFFCWIVTADEKNYFRILKKYVAFLNCDCVNFVRLVRGTQCCQVRALMKSFLNSDYLLFMM